MSKDGKKRLPLALEPILVTDRHQKLLDLRKNALPPVQLTLDSTPKTGILGENLEKKFANSLASPLPRINGDNPYLFPISKTFATEEGIQQALAEGQPSGTVLEVKRNGQMVGDGFAVNYRKALEPKVMLPFDTRPGQTPRKIEIERKKREFASKSIEELVEIELKALIDQGMLPTSSSHKKEDKKDLETDLPAELDGNIEKQQDEQNYLKILPLEIFYDTTFDSRTEMDYLDIRITPDNKSFVPTKRITTFGYTKKGYESIHFTRVPLPAKAFDGVEWRDCIVVAFDTVTSEWKVMWRSYNGWDLDKYHGNSQNYIHPEDETILEDLEMSEGNPRDIVDGKEMWIPRIELMFLSEDPSIVAKRIAKAYRDRYETFLNLKYNFIVDNMPIDVAEGYNDEEYAKLLNRAIGTNKNLRNLLDRSVGEELRAEVSKNFLRTMNKIRFELDIESFTDLEIYNFKLPTKEPQPPVPFYAKAYMNSLDISEVAKKFAFASFLTKHEVVETLSKVRVECDKLINTPIYATNISKTVKLDEFEQLQSQAINSMKLHLRESWIPAMRHIIKQGFKEVGKGWYNTSESNMEVYRISKLRKFMNTVKFIMQDSLRFLATNSLSEYVKHISSLALQKVEIKDTNDVVIINQNNEFGGRKPLFLIDLQYKHDRLQYNMDLDHFEDTLIAIADRGFGITEMLPQLEPLVLENIFWASKPMLQNIHCRDSALQDIYAKLVNAIRTSVSLLKQYSSKYEKYTARLSLDIAQFSVDYEAQEKPLSEMDKDINQFNREWEEIEKGIPSHISLGLFWVSCDSIRNILKKDLSKVVLDIISLRASKMASSISQKFTEIQSKLKDKPSRIEELVLLKEFMLTVPDSVDTEQGRIKELLNYYEILDRYRYESSNEQFRLKWNTVAWPGKIEELLDATEKMAVTEEQNFHRSLLLDQEVFKERINALSSYVNDLSKQHDISRINDIVEEVLRIGIELKDSQDTAALINSRERLFGLEVSQFDEIQSLPKEFENYKNLWLTANDWLKSKDQWLHGSFIELDAEEVEKQHILGIKNIVKATKTFKTNPGCLAVAVQIKEELDEFKTNIPLIQALRNPGMKDRHWSQLSKEINIEVKLDEKLTLTDLLKKNLLEKIDLITKVCDVAGKEYSIENALDKMEQEWKNIQLEIIPYKETGTYVMKIAEDVTRMLDDHIVMTQSMGFSPFKKPFADRIFSWELKLRTVQEVLDAWAGCQRSWLYLEPIFSSEDIVTQLPVESKRFMSMDRSWRRVMMNSVSRPGLIESCSDPKLLDTFKECNKLLEMVAKGLSAYLESKRISFPRFFFLSDDELLQILSQTKDPAAVQPHLRKCFENIASIEFGEKNLITAMFSGEGEKVEISEPFYPRGPVEEWLLLLEQKMKESVKSVTSNAIDDYAKRNRNEWVLRWPGQAVLATSQTFWTQLVTAALKDGTTEKLKKNLLDQLQGLVSLVRGELNYLARLILGDLIVIDVHNRDVVQMLIDNEVSAITDFEWISQLRYYWEDNDLRIKIVNANFRSGYEYLGNTGRLVITPLTDRCYLTLTGAIHLVMGGAPAGPAGTGKTETVKDLAKSLAKQCVVFNCSDQLDYLAMAKFFKGLAASGAWACFDEFNRIDIEVLSVIAQQIMTIQKACAAGLTKFLFEGVDLPLDITNAIFITMNPGYAGRTELPDNLKALFRPVAMMIPNYAMIGEISLFSFGFSNAKILAEKMVATFKLSSEQLSSQDHYDFGMRAVKTVISSAGNIKREQPDSPEDLILLRALCDCNLPKFLAEDVPLFNGIISDLFPGITQPKFDYGSLSNALQESCQYYNLQPEPSFIDKCIQLFETTIVRHGLMLVGPAGGGKTSCLRVLSRSLGELKGKVSPTGYKFQKANMFVLNPKSITMGQIYGEFDLMTHEWTDGILSTLMREGTEDTSDDRKWYIFDGPVDAVWVESMNTLLDDNKKLCLTSGEIIKMNSTQTMMFEVADLAFASPATVSRCGMIYMEPGALGVKPIVTSWMQNMEKKLPDNLKEPFGRTIGPLISKYLLNVIEFTAANLKEPVPTTPGNQTRSMLNILECLLVTEMKSAQEAERSISPAELIEKIEPYLLFSIIWSFGASTDNDGRARFDIWIREQTKGCLIPFPSYGFVFDYQFSGKEKRWMSWLQTDDVSPEMGIIPTLDTVRNTFLISLLTSSNYHVLCTGSTGTGKTITIQQKLAHELPESTTPITLNFSARTNANQTQDMIDSKMEKRRKGVFGPPVGKSYLVFIDDLNMPQLDLCNAQPPIELFRQWLDWGGWYDRNSIGKFMEIVDISLLVAMGHPGGGRNPVTTRFTRQFNLINFVEMDHDSLDKIFSTILGGFLKKFPEAIQELTNPVVSASIDIYDTIRKELLPTPNKSHYTFNLRDLAKVVQGMLSADLKTVSTNTDLVRLWSHECMRVFQDRLIDEKDKNWFKSLLTETMNQFLGIKWEEVVSVEPLLYGDYLTPGAEAKSYCEVKDLKKLVRLVEEYLDDYNSTSTNPMKLVMFLDAIEHVSRICRIIRQPAGNALLLGVGGSGRQSLSRLAAFMEEYEIFQIEISKNYGLNEWKEDLKKVLFISGLEGKSQTFLITDTQIISENCLEDLNNILNGGDVPNIYNAEEMDRILNGMRPLASEAGVIPTKENLFAYYISRVRNNLHLIICMSPIGDAFRNRLRMFPSLVNCCTIDWFSTWPEDALKSVAANSVSDIADLGTEEIIDGIVSLCVYMQESVREKCIVYKSELNRNNYVTPKSYLELLNLYKKLLGTKRNELLALRKRTATGLDKLLAATKEVETLQEELEAMQPMLLQTSQDTEATMKKIATDKIVAEEMKEVIAKEEAIAEKSAEETRIMAEDAKRDLDEALPALDAAVESLNSLTKGDIIEVRSMQRPPDGVKLVIEALCIMKNIKPKKVDGDKPGKKVDDYWEPGKGLLSDPQKFLDSLLNFDKDAISDVVISKIKPYIDSPDFQVSVISRVSKAATSMCQWVRAMEKYFWVAKSVAPKRKQLEEAQQSLDQTMQALGELKRKMRESEVSIKEMEKRYTESVAKKEELSRKVEECNLKLSRAGKLITGLAGEKQRWAVAVEQFDINITNIVGNVLLASGAVAYLGPFTAEYRNELLAEWNAKIGELGIPHTNGSTLWETLGDGVKLREWELNGLPKDGLSRDNAIIVQYSRRWPLLIDPQGQANKWIRNTEKDNALDIIKLTDRDFLRTLENAIRFGKPVLLENVGEKLDPALEPVLLKQTFKQGGSTVIKIGDSILPFHDDFRFYITTKLPNPHYSPEASATVTILNFTLAPSGLEDQLLAIVVARERPDLEEAKNQLTMNNAQMKRELKDIEDKILYLLSSVQGSPVDDERLIDTLGASKETSEEIQKKVAIAEQTEIDIDATRNQYVPVATRTRILFFCITELAAVDPMYQYSLVWFMNLFVSAIGNSEKSDITSVRVSKINSYFSFSLFSNVCRSLFERHKLLFSFLLTIRILMDEDKVDRDEWKFLLAGSSNETSELPNPVTSWLAAPNWSEILQLSTLPNFASFDADFKEYSGIYKALFDSNKPQHEYLPPKWQDSLSQFQKLLVLKCLRPDKITVAVQEFVGSELGERFVEPQTSDLGALYKESSPMVPLIFVLSPGADPASSVYKFAEDLKMSKRISAVSLGQGQGPRAEALIKEGMERGMWVLLQNCHLAPSWMPSLDRIIDGISLDKVHRDFRLWLTSMPSIKFPVTILQNGVKTTMEPPNGIKANLLRTYANFDEEFLSQCSKVDKWRKLLFSLCFFHAVIQERRKFGPLGWNIPYEFTDGDLAICVRQLKMFLEEYEESPFKVLKYTVGEINYGGRVTDDWDRRLIRNILEDYYNPEVLAPNYKFSISDIYYNIEGSSYIEYKEYIKSLPIEEGTEIFSMHANANITFAQKQTTSIFETLVKLMPKSGSRKAGKSSEDVLLDMANMIQSKVPFPFPLQAVLKKYPIEYSESMSTVLVQEVIRYNKLLAAIHSSIVEVSKALKGLVVLSESLEKICNSMFVNQVPAAWAAKAYPSLKPLSSWISDLINRCEFIETWVKNGIPNIFWISGFFFPQAFLTGTLQNFARKYVVSIDLLSLDYKVLDLRWEDILTRPSDGCYIRGLFLEGARWDNHAKVLAESKPKELYTEMNVIWLLPKTNRKKPLSGIYECPVYKTLTRAGTLSTTGHSTNYVLTIELPSNLPQSHWVKRGVALITSLAY